jgi:hypothetical protein
MIGPEQSFHSRHVRFYVPVRERPYVPRRRFKQALNVETSIRTYFVSSSWVATACCNVLISLFNFSINALCSSSRECSYMHHQTTYVQRSIQTLSREKHTIGDFFLACVEGCISFSYDKIYMLGVSINP